jgi:hypothetical protein
MRVGDIVRTPTGGLFGDKPAIIQHVEKASVTVHTGTAELLYEADRLIPLATIALTPRSYKTPSGNRFRVCRVLRGNTTTEYHVLVGAANAAPETRANEVRTLLFLELVRAGFFED